MAAIFGPSAGTTFTQTAGVVALSGGYQPLLYQTDVERISI